MVETEPRDGKAALLSIHLLCEILLVTVGCAKLGSSSVPMVLVWGLVRF